MPYAAPVTGRDAADDRNTNTTRPISKANDPQNTGASSPSILTRWVMEYPFLPVEATERT